MTTFGERLRRARSRAGLSQPNLAAAAGLSLTTLRNIESDKTKAPYPKTVRALSTILGVTDDDLRDDPPTKPDSGATFEVQQQSEFFRFLVRDELQTVRQSLAQIARSVQQLHTDCDEIRNALESLLPDVPQEGPFQEPR